MWFVWFVQGWFFAHFPRFPILMKIQIISQTIWLRPNERYRGFMERGWHIVHCLIVWGWMTLPGGCTKNRGRYMILRRYVGIHAGSCAVLKRCIVTCLRELNGSTDTCITSLDIWHMLFKCETLILCRLSLTFVLTPLSKTVGVIRQERHHDGWRTSICYGTLGILILIFCHIFWDLLWSQQMMSRSLHTSGSSTRREARLIHMIWLVALFPMMMSTWVRRW